LDYNYLWNDLANTETSTVSNLIANTYTVIVTDANDCQASIDVTISEPEGVEINFVEVIPVVCYSQNNGSITIDPQGGSSPYTVHWNNPAGSNGYTIANLTAGYYTVTVTDLHNCQLVDSVEVIQPDSIYIQATINPVICAQQLGSVGITTFGGTAPYSFLWSSEETVPALFNKPAGIYFVTITDAHDCQLLTNIEIGTQGHIETTITQTNDNLCFKDEIASLLASSANGMSPITFIWSTGSTEQEIFNLGANEYFVTINDSWGCNGRDSIIVTEPPVIDLNIFTDNIKCKGDLTGSASITISGGTEPYSPLWQNGDITFFTNSLAAGQIWVTITDYNNCRDSIAAVITEPDSNVKINLNITNITCFRAQDGLINSFATGGTPPYFYYWNINGQTINDATIRELDFGTYNLTVVDNNNCLADTTVKLVEPDILKSSYIEGDPSCEGNFDGFINVVTSGGTQPYSYFMDEIQLESYFIDSLFQGEYYVQIIDSNNCTYSIGPIVLVDEEIDCLHIPAAFSPNGDGYNDEWFLENIQVFPKSMVQIYNRWGQLLYEERGIDGFWDGTYNGNPLPTGVYMYLIRLNNDSPDRTGTVTVVR
jgi:gliding motility-associated-like protein